LDKSIYFPDEWWWTRTSASQGNVFENAELEENSHEPLKVGNPSLKNNTQH
jgi:hypothetical protein